MYMAEWGTQSPDFLSKLTKVQAVPRVQDSMGESRLLVNFWVPHLPMRGMDACMCSQTIHTALTPTIPADLKVDYAADHRLSCRLD